MDLIQAQTTNLDMNTGHNIRTSKTMIAADFLSFKHIYRHTTRKGDVMWWEQMSGP